LALRVRGGLLSGVRRPLLRLALFYAVYFAIVGVQLPFWPVWLRGARGQTDMQIGVLTAAAMWVRTIANPLLAPLVTRSGRSRRPIVALTWASCAAFGLFWFANDFWALLTVSVLFGALISVVLPIGETLTLRTTVAAGVGYGRVRLWGSLGFIAAAAVAGQLVEALPAGDIFWIVLAVMLALALTALLLPEPGAPSEARAARPVRGVFARAGFPLFLAATALIQGSHAAYYAFATLHWRKAGVADDTIGLLWAEAVAAEVVLFVLGGGLLRRLGPLGLIGLGGAAGGVRWVALALTAHPAALVATQWLHAFTFGATHLGAIYFIASALRPQLGPTAQALYAGIANGGGLGLATLAAGALYERGGGVVWLWMAGCSALGLAGVAMLARATRRAP
jgi:PPP family 3-phenylpropionic acid transporter